MRNLRFKIQNITFFAITFSICTIFLCQNIFAQDAAKNVLAQAANVSEFEVNGLKVLVKKRAKSQTVAVGLFIKGGTQNLTAKNAGIESFMLNAMSEASTKFPKARLRRELSRTGSVVTSGSNYDYSVFSLITTRYNFDLSWEIFTDLAMNPSFAVEDIERLRQQTLSGFLNDEDDADSYLSKLSNKTAYANHPYQNAPRGTAESIGRFKPADLRAYHKEVMQTSRLLMVVVGDIEADILKRQVQARFGKLPRGKYKNKLAPALNFTESSLEVTAKKLPTNYVKGVFATPSLNNPDYYAMETAMTILRERVFQEVRVERNLSYAPDAFMNENVGNLGGIYVSANDANQSVSIMLDEIAKLQNEEVQASQISGVVGQFLTQYYAEQETNAAQTADLARYELTGGGWRKSFEFLEKTRAVKPADVQRVSKKYMKNLRFVVLGNPAFINRGIFLGQNTER